MLSSRILKRRTVKTFSIRAAFNEAQRQRKLFGREAVFDFSIGNPGAPVPSEALAAIENLARDRNTPHSYMCEAGYDWVRHKISQSLRDRFGTAYTCDNIIMTPGAAGALNCTLGALLDPSDEVVIIRPYYPPYIDFIENHGGRAVVADSNRDDFQPDLDSVSEKITARTKAVIINSPNNPSGAVYSAELAAGLCAVLKNKMAEYQTVIYLITDEPYRELVYDNVSPPVWANIYPNTVMIYSFSKSLSLPGERIGYAAISPDAQDSAALTAGVRTAMGMLGYVNAPASFQSVAAICADIKPDIGYYAENRRLLYEELNSLGFQAPIPQGAFYIFVKSPLAEEVDFLEAARLRHLMFVGGTVFDCPGYARLSFCIDRDTIIKSFQALKLLAEDCHLPGQKQ